MISLYPLLVSNTISRNIVPGVCKVLENHIMVYGLSSLLQDIRTSPEIGGNWTVKSKKVVKMEDIDNHLPEFLYREFLAEANGGSQIYGQTSPGNKQQQQASSGINVNVTMAGDKDKGKDSSIRLDTFNTDSISLEPTWMKIDQYDKNGNKLSGVIGVKVVPYAVKSDAELSQLLMYDNQVAKLQRLAILTGRKMTSFLYRTWMKVWTKVPFVGGQSATVTGDPRKDILLKRNILHAKQAQGIFVLANQAELSDNFYASAKGMSNLQKMGWGSIIIADDVNRRVAFCMKELNGLCSLIPYTMLYQTFSQAKVYEDIEDAKRNASSIFKVKREKMAKLIGEGISQNKIEKFGSENLPIFESEFVSEIQLIDENIASFMQAINPGKLKKFVGNIMKGNFGGIPKVSNEKIIQYGMKIHPEFRKGHNLAKKVIENSSPDISPEMASYGASVVSAKAAVMTGDYMDNVKAGIKQVIKFFRRFKMKSNPDKVSMPKTHYMDAVFGWSLIIVMFVGTVLASPIFIGMGQLLSKFAAQVYTFIEGFDKQKVSQAVEEISREARAEAGNFVEVHMPGILLALLIIVSIFHYTRR